MLVWICFVSMRSSRKQKTRLEFTTHISDGVGVGFVLVWLARGHLANQKKGLETNTHASD